MAVTPMPHRALMLPERCDFTLLHCGQAMTYTRSCSTWQGEFPTGTSTVENGYRCEQCGATVSLTVVEPDQPEATDGR
jgi:hypothetical protein